MSMQPGPEEEGSVTDEMVVVTPVLLFLVFLVVVFGRVAEARQQVVEASRAGAEIASVQPDGSDARAEAQMDANVGFSDHAGTCSWRAVTTDISHFHPGGYVTVTIVCKVSFADLSVPGIPGSTTVQATSTAPIDPYRSVR